MTPSSCASSQRPDWDASRLTPGASRIPPKSLPILLKGLQPVVEVRARAPHGSRPPERHLGTFLRGAWSGPFVGSGSPRGEEPRGLGT
eukprot:9488023-Alexandrium_andersonii.AAC.1